MGDSDGVKVGKDVTVGLDVGNGDVVGLNPSLSGEFPVAAVLVLLRFCLA